MPDRVDSDEKFPGIVDAIMVNAQEESDLYQVVWDFNSLYPSVLPAERLSGAKSTVLDLLEKKKIELHRYKYPFGEWEIIDPSRWNSVIELSSNWESTSPRRYGISLTDGEWT